MLHHGHLARQMTAFKIWCAKQVCVCRAAQMSQYIAHGGQVITDLTTVQAALKDWLGDSLPIPAEGEIITASAGHVKRRCSSTDPSGRTGSEPASVCVRTLQSICAAWNSSAWHRLCGDSPVIPVPACISTGCMPVFD